MEMEVGQGNSCSRERARRGQLQNCAECSLQVKNLRNPTPDIDKILGVIGSVVVERSPSSVPKLLVQGYGSVKRGGVWAPKGTAQGKNAVERNPYGSLTWEHLALGGGRGRHEGWQSLF